MVACYAEGMVVKMDWPLSDIKVNGKFIKSSDVNWRIFCGGI